MVDLWAFRTPVGEDRAGLSGMAVHARDGNIGTVKDVLERDGRMFLVVETDSWPAGTTIEVPAGLVTGIDVGAGVVSVDRGSDELQAPRDHSRASDDEPRDAALTRHDALDEDDDAHDAAPSGAPASVPAALVSPPAGESAEPGGGGVASPDHTAPGAETTAPAPASEDASAIEQLASGRDVPDAAGATSSTEQSVPEHPAPDAGGTFPSAAQRGAAEQPEELDTRTAPSPEPFAAEQADVPETAAAAARSDVPSGPDLTRDGASASSTGSESPESSRVEARGARPAPDTAEEPARRSTPRRPPTRSRDRAADGGAQAKPQRQRTKTTKREASAGGQAKPKQQRGTSSANEPPLARYDALTAAEVVDRLRALTQKELASVERYEKRGDGRQTILRRVAALREKEPWRGYDEATVKEVKEKLARAKVDRVTAVRDYERRHRNRSGVMDVARRKLENM